MKKPSTKIPNELIDVFAYTYLKNVEAVAEKVWTMTGEYNHIKNISILEPMTQ
jgi:hypothetical protein